MTERTKINSKSWVKQSSSNLTSLSTLSLSVSTDERTPVSLNWFSNRKPLIFNHTVHTNHQQISQNTHLANTHLQDIRRSCQQEFSDMNGQPSIMVAADGDCFFCHSHHSLHLLHVSCTNLTTALNITSLASNGVSNNSTTFQILPTYQATHPKQSAATFYCMLLLSVLLVVLVLMLVVLLLLLVTLVLVCFFQFLFCVFEVCKLCD